MDTSLDLGYSTWIIQVSKEHRNFQLHGIKTILESILEENIIRHKCLVFLAYVQQEAQCHIVSQLLFLSHRLIFFMYYIS